MPATLRRLLGDAGLGLRLLTPEATLPAGALGLPVSWVHSSDLPDPTPFLSAGQVLLTTGTQLPADGTDAAEATTAYVSRLAAHGIAGLGFGTDVVRAGTPASLVEACRVAALALFEVPYRTPFIAVARLAADITAEDAYARSTWALRAQRAISVAATRPDGLSATLAELSRQLHHWVALVGAGGTLDRLFPEDAVGDDTLETVRTESARLLRRGQRASTTVLIDGETLTLQTLGGRGRLRGILVLGGSAGLDEAGQQVVTSVIALAGLALEQNHALDRARGHLRSGLLRLVANGDVELVENISREMWGPLPAEPVVVAVARVPAERLEAVAERLELQAADAPGRLFFALDDERVVLCVSADAHAELAEIATALELRLGASDPAGWTELPRALAQAAQALQGARDGERVTDFASVSARGVLALLDGDDAREVGRSVLAPLRAHDAAHPAAPNQTGLVETLRAWLIANGEYEAAARALGVHRHTLRARVATAERLLGRDLAPFAARAELWAALLATG